MSHSLISDLLLATEVDFDWSDALIRAGLPLMLVSPSGNRPYGEPCTIEAIREFAEFAVQSTSAASRPIEQLLKDGSLKPALNIESAGQDGSKPTRLRLTISRAHCEGGLTIVVRRVPMSVPTLKEMGTDLATTTGLLQGSGLVLVTGPTKQGKSTLMAALIEELRRTNDRISHIVKVEDPIEFCHDQSQSCVVTQREIGTHVASYKEAAEDALRMAPGAVSLGEIREADDAIAAINLGESGHLVFVTMQATTVEGALLKLRALASASHGTADAIAKCTKAVIRTALIPSADGCRYKMAYEWLVNTGNEVPELINSWNSKGIRDQLRSKGFGRLGGSLNASILDLVGRGDISWEAAQTASNDLINLTSYKNAGVAFSGKQR